jgi:hypothetical protein
MSTESSQNELGAFRALMSTEYSQNELGPEGVDEYNRRPTRDAP